MWLPVTGGCVQGPLQNDAHQNCPLLKEWIVCTPGSWVLGTSGLSSARWLGCLGNPQKIPWSCPGKFFPFSSWRHSVISGFLRSWEDFNTQLVGSGNLSNSDPVRVWMEILTLSPSGCKFFGCLTLSSAVWRSHVEAEAASVVEGVLVPRYEHLPKSSLWDTWTADHHHWSDNLSNLHDNVRLRTSLSVIQCFHLPGVVRMSWGFC